jgi:hypothetical protein
MRPYRTWFNKNNDTGLVNCWFVSDQTEEENEQERKLGKDRDVHERWRYHNQEEIRPRVATFPVSQLYPSDEQERRAKMLCDYLNRIREATEQAEKHAILIDAIKGAPQTP